MRGGGIVAICRRQRAGLQHEQSQRQRGEGVAVQDTKTAQAVRESSHKTKREQPYMELSRHRFAAELFDRDIAAGPEINGDADQDRGGADQGFHADAISRFCIRQKTVITAKMSGVTG